MGQRDILVCEMETTEKGSASKTRVSNCEQFVKPQY
jgi:hypothetical protein